MGMDGGRNEASQEVKDERWWDLCLGDMSLKELERTREII